MIVRSYSGQSCFWKDLLHAYTLMSLTWIPKPIYVCLYNVCSMEKYRLQKHVCQDPNQIDIFSLINKDIFFFEFCANVLKSIVFITQFSVSDEPEDEVSFEDLEERAKSGEAKAQTKVSGNNC